MSIGDSGSNARSSEAGRCALGAYHMHVLQRILGHKSIETTRGYLHPDTRHLTSAAEQANAFLDAQEQRPSPAQTPAPARPTPGR